MKKWVAYAVVALLIASISGLVALTRANANLHKQISMQTAATAAAAMAAVSPDYSVGRIGVIQIQLLQVKKPIIFMGDSLVEGAYLPPTICGHPVINAGVGGARIGFFAKWAAQFTKVSEPALVVLSVGINDAGKDSDETSFQADYAAALQSLRSPVAVATILGTGTHIITAAEINQLNRDIRQTAGGRTIIDLHEAVPSSLTIDGIHLNSDGYKIWTAAMLSGVRHALSCGEPAE